MNKYLFKNKFLLMLYLIGAIVTYLVVVGIYNLHSLITEVAEKMQYSRAMEVILYSIGVLVILFVVLIIITIIQRIILSRVSYSIREDIFNKIYDMKLSKFADKDTAYYTSMIVNDVTILEDDYFNNIIEFIGDSIQLIVTFFAIILAGWQYALVVALFAIFSAIQPFILKNKLARDGVAVSKELEGYTAATNEYISGFENIKCSGNTSIFNNMYANKVDKLEGANYKLWSTKVLNGALMMLAVYVLKIGSEIFFTYNAVIGALEIATVSLLFGLANNVGNPIASLLSYLEPINSSKDVLKKLEEFLSMDVSERETGKDLNAGIKELKLSNVNFAYEDKKIINGLSISFEQGKKYALVGESGSGKSTILKLIMGYYDNYEGSICFDNQELKTISFKALRDKVTYITQSAFLSKATLKDNITLGGNEVEKDRLNKIISTVALDELIDRLPDGINEEVEDGAENFSGGEKQRVALARALVKNNDIILMDESTSALDNLTAFNIEKQLLSDKSKTIISVIHRFNDTIKDYDCIYFLENGQIAEAGTYEELLNKNGKFKNMISTKGDESCE